MEYSSQPMLTNAETMEMLTAFYQEALRFLEVPEELLAEVKQGTAFDASGRAKIISIDFSNKKILVSIPALQLLVQAHPQITGDAPSVYRSHGYKLARIWQQYITKGECHEYELDKDSCDFAMALGIIKGLPQVDYPNEDLTIQTIGYNPFDRAAAIRMLREEFGIDCYERQAITIKGEKGIVVSLTKDASLKHATRLNELYEASIIQPLPNITEGQLGSQNNPFPNVDAAADYILKIEKERLENDPYRQAIDNEQYYYDYSQGVFRIPWASANVSYYPLESDNGHGFVVNQLSQRLDHYHEMPRFTIKPSLAHNKFLFRGQSQFFEPCVPNMFRDKAKVQQHRYVDDVIQTNELEVLLYGHPLVKLFNQGFYLLHEFFRFKVDYQGISQHYYNRTQLLDLTSDMEVAKFFAVTWFNMDEDRYERYNGNELGVLYYYDLAPDAFRFHEGRDHLVETIGKQPFMRSGNQSGFLIRLDDNMNFNALPEVRYVFFRHNASVTDRIFAESNNGDKYMPQELLRTHWYRRMSDPKARKEISLEALRLNYEHNKHTSPAKIREQLQSKDFHFSSKNMPCFTDEELDLYYAGVLDFWNDFCSNIHFYSPEGGLLKKHLTNLPNDPRYRWAFFKSNKR